MNQIRFTILGCGSSGGVPRLGNKWGVCDPKNPKNKRQRCSMLVERIGKDGTTTVLVDTSPDMREQLLTANIGWLDGVIYTHEHADHVHGLDDLRMIVINRREKLAVYASGNAKSEIRNRFSYAFETPDGSDYPPILEMHTLSDELIINGKGGPIKIETFDVPHGTISVRAVKINGVLYTPDISDLPQNPNEFFAGIDTWILDCLRHTPHPSHVNVETALGWIKRFNPKNAVLTNLHIDLDYDALSESTPNNVVPAFDGMQITFPI